MWNFKLIFLRIEILFNDFIVLVSDQWKKGIDLNENSLVRRHLKSWECDIDAFVQELNFERENLVKTSNLCRNLEKKIEDLKNDQNSAQRHVQALEKMIRDNKEEKFKLVKKNEGLQDGLYFINIIIFLKS